MQRALCFDDVLLEPQYSEILSRSHVDLSLYCQDNLTKPYSLADGLTPLTIPIVGSPMDTVIGPSAAKILSKMGGFSILHRYVSIPEQVSNFLEATEAVDCGNVGCAIGSSEDYLRRAKELYDYGCKIFCIDVAHGHHINVKNAVISLRKEYGNSIHIMGGNVATLTAFNDLSDWGCDSIRVSVGSGGVCTTRIQTGHGIPTFQAVLDCSKSDRSALIVADGGIRNSGDAVKSLAAGADLIMLGSVLSGHKESPGDVINSDDGTVKVFRGMASKEAQEEWRNKVGGEEGVSTFVPYKGSLENTINQFLAGIRSGLSYSGASKLSQLRAKAKFVTVTSNTVIENRPHAHVTR